MTKLEQAKVRFIQMMTLFYRDTYGLPNDAVKKDWETFVDLVVEAAAEAAAATGTAGMSNLLLEPAPTPSANLTEVSAPWVMENMMGVNPKTVVAEPAELAAEPTAEPAVEPETKKKSKRKVEE